MALANFMNNLKKQADLSMVNQFLSKKKFEEKTRIRKYCLRKI